MKYDDINLNDKKLKHAKILVDASNSLVETGLKKEMIAIGKRTGIFFQVEFIANYCWCEIIFLKRNEKKDHGKINYSVSLKENFRGRKVRQLVTASQDNHESFLSIEFFNFYESSNKHRVASTPSGFQWYSTFEQV